jgi:8-amino-3,8-dideoxy-alpha-D-manno-octulosonate transaminase
MPGYELVGIEEQNEVNQVFANGGILCRRGFDNLRNSCYKVDEFESRFSRKFDGLKSLAVTSGTAALRVALAALNVGKGDEVITQCFTFVATVEAIIESGATPVCTEIDNSLNMDFNDLLKKITVKTKVIIVVHMLGIPCDLRKIVELCKERSIFLIEDTAWGCGGSLGGKLLGTWGDIGTFSFDFAKTITTGEGGMLIFKDERIFQKAAAWHDHGHDNNPSVPRWEDTRSSSGFNYRMSELQAAVGLAQLKKLEYVVERQRANRDIILKKLKEIKGLAIRSQPEGTFDTADAFIFFVESANTAIKCRSELLNIGISTKILPEAYTWHFAETWDHMPELVTSHGDDLENAFPFSRNLLKRSVSIPINVNMGAEKFDMINEAITKALNAK